MIIVPGHVKAMVDRIISEYEAAYKAKVAFYTHINVGGQSINGIDTTKYFLTSVKGFRKSLDTLDGPLYTGTFEEVIKKIYLRIDSYLDPLSVEAIGRVRNTVTCQRQLAEALRRCVKKKSFAADAQCLLEFIRDAGWSSWGQMDAYVRNRKFVLVDKSKFDAYLESGRTEELTPGTIKPYTDIRVSWERLSEEDVYRKKNLTRIYNNYWRAYRKNGGEYVDLKIFNFWYDVQDTAVYYVYIPNE